MSELFIKREIRKLLKETSLEVNTKMVCPIVKLFKMKYGAVDSKYISMVTTKLINEYWNDPKAVDTFLFS